jgi:putative transcriptional regulator
MMIFHKAQPRPGRSSVAAPIGMARSMMPATFLNVAAGLILFCLLAIFPALSSRAAQKGNSQVEFLIARNQVQDPYFRHSVVLMLPERENQLVVGLIINKPTRLTLGRLFPESPEMKDRTEYAYFGGPVRVSVASVVFRSRTAPENALRLYDNVYLSFDSDLIKQAFEERQTRSRVRLFLGRAQWAPGQLQNEIRRGGWYRIRAEGDLVFSPHPDSLWPTLHSRAAPSKYIRYRFPPASQEQSSQKSAVM